MNPRSPILLVTTAHAHFLEAGQPAGLGRLAMPRHFSRMVDTAAAGVVWAADNDGFNGFVEEPFLRMLDALEGLPGCRFVAAPDQLYCGTCRARAEDCACGQAYIPIGHAAETLERFETWEPVLHRRGFPVALVAQDGLGELAIPWDRIDALFIGGSTEFKLGDEARAIAQEATRRGKWVHWGRVNTLRRFRYIASTGAADSFDGTKFAKFRSTYLETGIAWTQSAPQYRLGV